MALFVVALGTVLIAAVVLLLWWTGGTPRIIGAVAATSLYDERKVVQLYRQVSPAVVEIKVTRRVTDGEGGGEAPLGSGSGFILDRDGFIVTSQHVIDGADGVYVKLSDGRTVVARVVGEAPDEDLALLRIDAQEVVTVVPVVLGNSDAVRAGQMAVALGNPFGLEGSVTVGVVSGIDRSLGQGQHIISGVLQTDASLNPGNSGGPLLNSKGEVIGINAAVQQVAPELTDGHIAGSIGFALPINHLVKLLPRLKQGGVVGRPYLGVRGISIDATQARRLGLASTQGIYVCEVLPGTAAAQAGIRASGRNSQNQCNSGSDVILSIDDRAVSSVPELSSYLNTRNAGDEIRLSIRRGANVLELRATLGELAPG